MNNKQNSTQNTILFIGDYKTGKTSIINRYIHNTFENKYIPSDFHTYNRFTHKLNEITYKFHIWETNHINYFINHIDIFVFVFDINNLDSLNYLMKYITFIYTNNNTPYKIFLVGNKTDFLTEQLNTQHYSYIQSFINNIKTYYFTNIECIIVSALNNTNIDYLFESIINTCINKKNIKHCKIQSKNILDSNLDDNNLDDNNCCGCNCC